MANDNIECPVDFVSINENKTRITAGIVFFLVLVFLFTSHPVIPFLLTIDFFFRAFNLAKYSPLNFVSDYLVALFSVKDKPVDRAPKRFAAKTGFLFSAGILALYLLNLNEPAVALAIVLATFALLESAIGFCAGCYLYNFYSKFLKKKAANVAALLLLVFASAFTAATAQSAKTETTFTIENYYKIKWGFADEFINLWKVNHYPLLKKAIEKGDIVSVIAEKPKLHSGEDTRWDFKVTLVFKNSDKAFDANLTEPYKKAIYPDVEKLKRDEQHRFELLIAHWDVLVDRVATD